MDASDEDVVRLAAEGDEEAWGELVRRYRGLVYRVARRAGLSDTDAADVCQVTWLRLMDNVDRIRDPRCIAGWLATTARRESLRMSLGATRHVPCADLSDAYDIRHEDGEPSGADVALLRHEQGAFMQTALERLPPPYRQVLRLLSSDDGLSYAQIAAVLGLPVGSIGPMRLRALRTLRHDRGLQPWLEGAATA